MKIGITKLLPENFVPSKVTNLAIFDNNGNKICDVDISKMQLPNLGTKLYSFGLLSDIHMSIWSGDIDNVATYETVLAYLDKQGCDFVCVCGDLTNTGFHAYEDDATINEVNWYDEAQFAHYKRINKLHPNMPVYGICGNHEGYVKPITENLTELEEFTGNGLTYTITQGEDLFIFIGQTSPNRPMSQEQFAWLGEMLEANKDRRCFVFIHPFIDASDSGNPLRLHAIPLFDYASVTNDGYSKSTFANLMANYPNVIVFHGHSHMRFENQESVSNANYSTALGFKSAHVPSTAYCRDIRSGSIVKQEIAQGYIVDVYENNIVLKGYDFTANSLVPIAQYCINTTLKLA
ncbi:MAG: metallophosphoesterase family protein [Lachnospiraceae bacterium]|nr:metallophosphoesterase family protein [Lachnospiraceae bacterium]